MNELASDDTVEKVVLENLHQHKSDCEYVKRQFQPNINFSSQIYIRNLMT